MHSHGVEDLLVHQVDLAYDLLGASGRGIGDCVDDVLIIGEDLYWSEGVCVPHNFQRHKDTNCFTRVDCEVIHCPQVCLPLYLILWSRCGCSDFSLDA